MTKFRKLLIAAVAGATMLVGVVPAQAATVDLGAVTKGGEGKAHLARAGDQLWLLACDQKKDGFGVRAYASVDKKLTVVKDADGANGNCVAAQVAAAKGKPIYFKVCLRDHDAGTRGDKRDFACGAWKTAKA